MGKAMAKNANDHIFTAALSADGIKEALSTGLDRGDFGGGQEAEVRAIIEQAESIALRIRALRT
jgi:hypothetical protein